MLLTDKTILAVTTSMLHATGAFLEVTAARADLKKASEQYASGDFSQQWMLGKREEYRQRVDDILARLDEATASNVGTVKYYASQVYDVDPAKVDPALAVGIKTVKLGPEDGRRLIEDAVRNDRPMDARAYAAALEDEGHKVTLGIDAYREQCEQIAEEAATYAHTIAGEEPTVGPRGELRTAYMSNIDAIKAKLVDKALDAEKAVCVVAIE